MSTKVEIKLNKYNKYMNQIEYKSLILTRSKKNLKKKKIKKTTK